DGDPLHDGVLLRVHDVDHVLSADRRVDARAGTVHRHRAGRTVERDRVGSPSAEIEVEKVDATRSRNEDVVVLVAWRELLRRVRVIEELLLTRREVDLLRAAGANDERGDTVTVRADDPVVDRDRPRARL